MDTTKEYISMCGKADEIQNLWDGRCRHNFIIDKESYRLSFYESTLSSTLSQYYIWLPRQDQLQDMVKDKFKSIGSIGSMCFHFSRFVDRDLKYKELISMEQLWLAFVMKEKYKKTWNGKEWVL